VASPARARCDAKPSLGDVACATAGACFAVGMQANGTLIERWDGARWSLDA